MSRFNTRSPEDIFSEFFESPGLGEHIRGGGSRGGPVVGSGFAEDIFGSFHGGAPGGEGGSAAAPPRKAQAIERNLPCTLEDLYKGTTKKMKISRDVTDSTGRPSTTEEILTIEIRPGWKKGTKITFPEKGNEQRGIIPADIVFIIDEKPHGLFKRDGNDLVLTQKISLVEALTGYTVQLTTLDGRNLTIPINSVIGPTYEEVVKDEGMPIPKEPTKRGNLRVKFNIKFPSRLTSEQKTGITSSLNFRTLISENLMAGHTSSLKSEGSSSPLLASTENHSIPITTHILNGDNYLQWSQSVQFFICGKGKDEYLTGEAIQPSPTDTGYQTWKTDNDMVMSWLISSMTTSIGENFLLYSTSHEIWEAAKETYSSSDNTSKLFEAESTLYNLHQGDTSVTTYYTSLTRHWQMLDLFEKHEWKCPTDGAKYKEIVEKKRVFKFLLGLNKNFDEVRDRILSTKLTPKLRKAFSEVRHEESRQKEMLHPSSPGPAASDVSALMANEALAHDSVSAAARTPPSAPRQGRPYCNHCKRPGHTREMCWVLHGKPGDWKPRPRPGFDRQGNHSSSSDQSASETEIFSKAQLELLTRLITKASPSTSGIVHDAGSSVASGSSFGEGD